MIVYDDNDLTNMVSLFCKNKKNNIDHMNDKKLKRYRKKKFKIFIKYINVLYSNLNDSF